MGVGPVVRIEPIRRIFIVRDVVLEQTDGAVTGGMHGDPSQRKGEQFVDGPRGVVVFITATAERQGNAKLRGEYIAQSAQYTPALRFVQMLEQIQRNTNIEAGLQLAQRIGFVTFQHRQCARLIQQLTLLEIGFEKHRRVIAEQQNTLWLSDIDQRLYIKQQIARVVVGRRFHARSLANQSVFLTNNQIAIV